MTVGSSEEPVSESDLLARAIAGDTLALQRLLIGYQCRLLARIQRKLPPALRSTISAEDVLQEAYVDIVRGVRKFQPAAAGRQAFARWLIMVADSRLIDAIRAQQADKRGGGWQSLDPHAGGSTVTPLLDRVHLDSHSPSRSVAGHDVEAAIHAALAELKDDYREAVRLRFLQGLEISEVATRMGRTEWSVHKLCSRGLKCLRDVLGDGSRFWSQS